MHTKKIRFPYVYKMHRIIRFAILTKHACRIKVFHVRGMCGSSNSNYSHTIRFTHLIAMHFLIHFNNYLEIYNQIQYDSESKPELKNKKYAVLLVTLLYSNCNTICCLTIRMYAVKTFQRRHIPRCVDSLQPVVLIVEQT